MGLNVDTSEAPYMKIIVRTRIQGLQLTSYIIDILVEKSILRRPNLMMLGAFVM